MDGLVTSIGEWIIGIIPNPYVAVMLLSMIPMVEVKGAILIGVEMMDINRWLVCLLAYASSFVVCIAVLLLLRPILNALKRTKGFRRFAESVEGLFRDKAAKAGSKGAERGNLYKMLVIFVFVAIPLPLTGVWTGSAVAAFLTDKLRYSVPAVMVGNAVVSVLFTLMSYLSGTVQSVIMIVLAVFLVISVASVIFGLVRHARKSKREAEEQDAPGGEE